MALPKALWRYVLTFLDLSAHDVVSLVRVSTTWRRWVLSNGMIARCTVHIPRLAAPQEAMFALLAGVVELTCSDTGSCLSAVSGASLARLGGLQALTITCQAQGMDDSAFTMLTSLRKLHVNYWHKTRISDAAFAHLPLLQDLSLHDCSFPRMTEAGLAQLTALTRLHVKFCTQPPLTEAVLSQLGRLRCLHLSHRKSRLPCAAFSHLSCLEELDMSYSDIQDLGAAFVHFTQLHTLDMSGCSQPSICDASFTHLTRLTKLTMGGCLQETITDAAFSHLGNLVDLTMAYGAGAATGSGFKHLTSLRVLDCSFAAEFAPALGALPALTSLKVWNVLESSGDGPLLHLTNLLELVLGSLDSLELRDSTLRRLTCLTRLVVAGAGQLSDAAFTHSGGLLELGIANVSEWDNTCTVSDAAFAHLTSLTKLVLGEESGPITEAAFSHLPGLRALDLSYNHSVTDAWICQLTCLRELRLGKCNQESITDAAFRHLSLLEYLDIEQCTQHTITDAAFAHLPSLTRLAMTKCDQPSITPAMARHVRHVEVVESDGCSPEVVRALALVAPTLPAM